MSENYLLLKVACRFPVGLSLLARSASTGRRCCLTPTLQLAVALVSITLKVNLCLHIVSAVRWSALKRLQSAQTSQCIMGSVVHALQLFDQSLLPKVLQVLAPEHFPSQSQSVDTVDSNCTLRSSSSRTSTSKGPSKWRVLCVTSGWWIIRGKVMKDLLQRVGGDELEVQWPWWSLNPVTSAASKQNKFWYI